MDQQAAPSVGTLTFDSARETTAFLANGELDPLVHNHPSGIAEPSGADIMVTERLRRALALIDVRIVDHLIVGESVVSLAERGILC